MSQRDPVIEFSSTAPALTYLAFATCWLTLATGWMH
jgi:hypothetical protein